MRVDLTTLSRVTAPGVVRGQRPLPRAQGHSFGDALQSALKCGGELKLSAHAQQRLESRGIKLDEGVVARLEEAITRAEGKAAGRSLVLVDDMAFIVSVPSRTVITAIDGPRDGVFTNIDSAVIG
jgi:flagellar operon protein